MKKIIPVVALCILLVGYSQPPESTTPLGSDSDTSNSYSVSENSTEVTSGEAPVG